MFDTVRQQWLALSITLMSTCACAAILFGFAAAGWPGEELRNCFGSYLYEPKCYCERPRGEAPGDFWFAQPVNSVSNVAFVIVGLLIAVAADTRRYPSQQCWKNKNPMTQTRMYPVAFAAVTSLMGPGSTFLHASMTVWGSQVDVICMFLIALYLVVYGLVRLVPLSSSVAALLYCTGTTALSLWTFLSATSQQTLIVFIVLLAAAICFEGLVRWRRRGKNVKNMAGRQEKATADLRLLFLSIGIFGVGIAVWCLSKSGGPLCFPHSVFQGHGLWHILSAAAIGFLFLYALSEREVIEILQKDDADGDLTRSALVKSSAGYEQVVQKPNNSLHLVRCDRIL